MAPFMSSNRIVEDEERVSINLLSINQSFSDVSLDELASAVPSPKVKIQRDLGALEPPVTKMHLMMMDEQVSPPSIDVCHGMIFEGKVKMHMHNFQLHGPESLKHNENYWNALQRELSRLESYPLDSSKALLPKLLDEIKSMILYLYPDSKLMKENMMNTLDVSFLIDQIHLGNVDAVNLAMLLGTILKANCAPKRDGIIEHMVMLGAEGNWIGMFKLCLELMELMKLVTLETLLIFVGSLKL
jgi:hypothetical protein